jgi:hypothetical protein
MEDTEKNNKWKSKLPGRSEVGLKERDKYTGTIDGWKESIGKVMDNEVKWVDVRTEKWAEIKDGKFMSVFQWGGQGSIPGRSM